MNVIDYMSSLMLFDVPYIQSPFPDLSVDFRLYLLKKDGPDEKSWTKETEVDDQQ